MTRYDQWDGDYPVVRSALHPRYRGVSSGELERLIRMRLGSEAEDVENFMSGLSQIGGMFQRALPGAARGAATGAALGPWGALIGGLTGGATSMLSGGAGQPQPAPAPAAPHAAPNSGSSPASQTGASRLLSAVARPEIQQALLSMALGPAGRSDVSVGGVSVPVGAIGNLLSALGQRAGTQANIQTASRPGESEDFPEYLLDSYGSPKVDATDPFARAEALWELFESTTPEYAEPDDESTEAESHWEGDSEDYAGTYAREMENWSSR